MTMTANAELVPIADSIGLTAQLATMRDPNIILDDARKCAVALQTVITGKRKPVVFNGEQYLELEDWQTVGNFYQCAARTVSTTFVQFGDVQGFEATCEVVHIPTGSVVSRADAMCLNDEPKWRGRTKYDWRDVNGVRTKVEIGVEPVPLFQLRSMAQTRAGSKALRQAFAWVIVLAGFRPTPAEEMEDVIGASGGPAREPKHADAFATASNGDTVDTKTGEVVGGAAAGDYAPNFSGGSPAAPATEAPAAAALREGERLAHVTRVVKLKEGDNAKGHWTMYGIETRETGESKYLSTFDADLAKVANAAKLAGTPVAAVWTEERKGNFTNRTLTHIRALAPAREPGMEG